MAAMIAETKLKKAAEEERLQAVKSAALARKKELREQRDKEFQEDSATRQQRDEERSRSFLLAVHTFFCS